MDNLLDDPLDEGDPKQLTYWEPANSLLMTRFGMIRYLTWCHLEVDRLAAKGKLAEVRVNADYDVAVWYC